MHKQNQAAGIGRLRFFAVLEGISLILLIFVAVPVKHAFNEPVLVKVIGPVHGGLFLIFVINTLTMSIERRWKFTELTWKVLLACLIPFGTFYILKKLTIKM